MFAAKAPGPILPAHNELLLSAMWLMAAATLAAIVFLAAFIIKKTAWHVGFQLGRLEQPSR